MLEATLLSIQRGKLEVALEFKLADMWIGLYWRKSGLLTNRKQWDVWICILPCLPVHVTWNGYR